MDLNPTYESMVSTDDCLPIKVVSSVPGTVGEEDPPIFLKERTLTKEDWTPVDLKKLDPATRSLLKEHMNQVHSRNSSKRTDNSLGTMDVGDTIWFSPNYFGVVEEEIIYERIWHPLVLIDSEEGLTHQFDLGVFEEEKVSITSTMEYSGISASGTYTKTDTVKLTWEQPITTDDGEVCTFYGLYDHTYQEGRLYYRPSIKYPFQYLRDFQREYISKWRYGGYKEERSADLPEVRDTYLHTWEDETAQSIWRTFSESYTGTIGALVTREDVFGGVKLSVTYEYGVQAHHYFNYYNQPSSNCYIDFYAGRAFDINTRQYYAGGGGGGDGCPFLFVYDGARYVSEGLLNIHAFEDVIREHQLRTSPQPVRGRYLLRLREHHATHSYLDHVQLVATVHNGQNIILPLASAVHSADGNVIRALLLSDDVRTDTWGADHIDGTSEYIDLAFVAPSGLEIQAFTFIIEGYNYLVK